jgi:host factor-I protein
MGRQIALGRGTCVRMTPRRATEGGEDNLLNKRPANLQDGFLNQLRRQRIPITLFLSSGVQLRGQLAGFDSFVMILESPGKPTQLVYKHSIVSVAPAWAPAPPPPRPPMPEQPAAEGEETANPDALEVGHEEPDHAPSEGSDAAEATPPPTPE